MFYKGKWASVPNGRGVMRLTSNLTAFLLAKNKAVRLCSISRVGGGGRVLAADTADVLPADTPHVLPADKFGVRNLKFANYV